MNRLLAVFAASVLAMVVAVELLVGAGQPAQAALVAYWPMENGPGSGQASNAVSGGQPATLNNMDVNAAWVAGHSGNWALQLDGVNDYVLTPDVYAPIHGGGNAGTMSLSLWFNATTQGVVATELGQTGINTGWHDSQIEVLASGEVRARVWSLGSVSLGNITLNDGSWHHAVLVYDAPAGTLDGYLDNVNPAGVVTGARQAPGTGQLYYGLGPTDGTNLGSGAYFNGKIDDVAIWNNALGAADVQALFNGYLPGTTMTWDGSPTGNWGDPSPNHWIPSSPPPPTAFPDAFVTAAVASGKVTVDGARAAYSLSLTGGEVHVGAGNSLTVTSDISATGGTLSLGAGARLSAASGTIAQATTSGNSTWEATTGSLTVDRLSDQGIPGTLTKVGAGRLVLDNTAGLNQTAATSFRIEAGALKAIGANPLGGAGSVVLAGGTLEIPGTLGLPTANLELHLDAGAISGLSDGQVLTQWLDSSGHDHNTTSRTGNPTYQAAAIGGNPAVNLHDNSGFALGNLSGSFPSAATMFIVTDIDNDTYYNFLTTRANDTWWRYNGNGLSYPGLFRTSRVEQYTSMPTDGTYIFEVDSNSTLWEMFVDGQSRGAVAGQYNAGDSYQLSLYGGRYLKGSIAEVLVYNTALSTADREAVGAYLAGKYGISSSYPGATTMDLTGTNVTVEAGTTGSAINAIVPVDFGALSLGDAAELTTRSSPVRFQSTTLAGSSATMVVYNTTTLGTYDDGASAKTLTKRGYGTLVADNTTPGSIASTATDWRIEAGTLRAPGTNPLGAGGSHVTLAGAALEVEANLIDASGVDLLVTASSSVNAISPMPVPFGDLTLANGAILNISGASTSFHSTALSGGAGRSAGIDNGSQVNIGTFHDGATTGTFIKRGAGTMLVDDATAGDIQASGTTWRLEAGKIEASGTSPLGGTPRVILAGGTLELLPTLSATAPSGAAAYYSFENVSGTTVASEGSVAGKDGTLTNYAAGDPGITSASIDGHGMTVHDGSSERLNVPGGGGIDIGNEWTITAWFKDLHDTNNWRTLTRGAGGDHQIIVQSGTNRLGTYDSVTGGGFRPAGSATLLPYDGWHHVAAVGDETTNTTTYYVDGLPVGTADRSSTTQVTWIANGDTGWGQSFANVIDEFRVYNRALSATEIRDMVYGPPLDMRGTEVHVEGNSTLKVVGVSSASFGPLTLQGGVLTAQGPIAGIHFNPLGGTDSGVAAGAGSFGLNTVADVTIDGPYDGRGATASFTKTGEGRLTFAQGTTNHAGVSVRIAQGEVVSGAPVQAASLTFHNSGRMDTGAHNVTVSDGGIYQTAGNLTVAASGAAFEVGGTELGTAPQRLVVHGGTVTVTSGGMPLDLQVWFDAGTGVTTGAGNVVQSWTDQSGGGHTATLASGAPVLAAGQLNGLPVVQFRRSGGDDWLNVAGNLFAKEIYIVWRSPNAAFDNYGGILGAQSGRGSTFITQNADTIMHSNQYPVAVSRDGTVLASPFNMAPVEEFMLLKVVVNDNSPTPKLYQVGRVDGYSFSIDVAEILAFDHTLTASDENNVAGYLAAKYGLTTTYTGSILKPAVNLPNTFVTATASGTLDAQVDDTPGPDDTATFGGLDVKGGATLTLSGAPDGFFFGTAAGAGTVRGSFTVTSAIAPGDSVGTLDVDGNLTVASGTAYHWELGPDGPDADSAADHDTVDLFSAPTDQNTLTLGAWTLVLEDLGGEATASDKLYLFTGFSGDPLALDGGPVPTEANNFLATIDTSQVEQWMPFTVGPLRILQDQGGLYLTGLQTVPEPSGFVLAVLGLLGAGWYRLRRRRAG